MVYEKTKKNRLKGDQLYLCKLWKEDLRSFTKLLNVAPNEITEAVSQHAHFRWNSKKT